MKMAVKRKRHTNNRINASILRSIFRSHWLWFVVFQLMLINGWYLLYQRSYLSFAISAPPGMPAITSSIDTATQPRQVKIEAANIDVSVTPASITNGIWETSNEAASYLIYSAKPTQSSNIVIYAHNRPGLFSNLRQTKNGDEVTVTTEDGQAHRYLVTDKSIVKPNQVDVVMPTETEVLTLYTCTGWLDSQRLVIKAYPV